MNLERIVSIKKELKALHQVFSMGLGSEGELRDCAIRKVLILLKGEC